MNALFPIFFGLLLGYVAGLRKLVDNVNVRSLATFVMRFALPCALFITVARTPVEQLSEQANGIVTILISYVAIYFVTYLIERRIYKAAPAPSAVQALTLGFPNLSAVGIPLLEALFGPRAGASVAMAIAVGAVTVSPVTLAILEGTTEAGAAKSSFNRVYHCVMQAVRHPVVLAPIFGLLAAFLHWNIPTFLERSFRTMGLVTAGGALFLTGLIISAQTVRMNWHVISAVIITNILQPALALGLAYALKLPADQTRVVVLLNALPSGFFGMVFGTGFKVTPEVTSSVLLVSHAFSVVSLAGWIVFLNSNSY